MASSVFNPYPTGGTAWHHRKIVYGYVTEDAGSSVSWWIGLDRDAFVLKAQEAVYLRKARQPEAIATMARWVEVGVMPE